MSRTTKSIGKQAFTLIELLTVIAIIAILAALLIPAVNKVRQSARSSANMSLLRQSSLSVIQFVNEEGKYPRLWNNQKYFTGAGQDWFSIPAIRRALGDNSPNLDNHYAVSLVLMSPAQEMAEQIPEDIGYVVPHISYSPGPGNKHPDFNPTLTTFAVQNPSELILFADGGILENEERGQLYSACRPYMYQLNNLANGDVTDPDPISFEMSGTAKMTFDRHGNDKAQVSFCDGHVELRGQDEFYYKNFTVQE